MKKLILTLAFLVGIGMATPAAQTLSQQVLRLLVRDNYWSGINIFARTKGVTLESGSVAPAASTDTLYNIGGALYFNGVLVATSAGAGTVTSVGITAPAIFTIAGSPVTTAGTLALSLASQTANTIFAGPGSGVAATPTFRALVDLDVPDTITIDGTNNVTWASVNKAGSSLANLATKSATDLTSGTLPDARFPATLPVASGVNLTALNATNLGSGTVPAARMPALTGDITTSAGAVATTLANTGVGAGSCTVCSLTYDAKGRLTVAASGSAGTGTVTRTAGALTASAVMVGNGAFDSKVLASLGTTTTVLHGNAAGLPTWGAVALATDVSGTLPPANGGTGATTVPSNGMVPIGNGTTYGAATLTGTANQVTVTNGAGSITLALPQAIATSSTPQFARLGLGTGAGATALVTHAGIIDGGYFDNGNSGAADTITWTAGMVQKSTLTANVTYTFQSPTASGTWFTLVLIQGGVGSFTATWPGTITWEAATTPTLSTAVGAKDLIHCLYDGAVYLCRFQKGT